MLGASCSPCCSRWSCYYSEDKGPPVAPSNVRVQVPECFDDDGLKTKAAVCLDGPPPYDCVPEQVYEIAISGDYNAVTQAGTWHIAQRVEGANITDPADDVQAVGDQCEPIYLDFDQYAPPTYTNQTWQAGRLYVRVRAQSRSPGDYFEAYSAPVIRSTIPDYGSIVDPRLLWANNVSQGEYFLNPLGGSQFESYVSASVTEYGGPCDSSLRSEKWNLDYVAVPVQYNGAGGTVLPQPLPANPGWLGLQCLTLNGASCAGGFTANMDDDGSGSLSVQGKLVANLYDTIYLRLSIASNPKLFYISHYVIL